MITRKMVLVTAMLVYTIFIVPAMATTYYVAKDGDDSHDGNEAQPWLTIQKAADTMQAGDTVLVKGGTYTEQIEPKHSGSEGNWITYQAYPGNEVIIESPYHDPYSFCIILRSWIPLEYLHFKNLTLQGLGQWPTWACFVAVGETNVKSHIILEGLTITNAFLGIEFASGVTDSEIKDCNINNNGEGIYFDTAIRNTTIRGNQISYGHAEPNKGSGDGIVLTGKTPDSNMCSNITISNNIVNNVDRQGILIFCSNNVLVSNNYCHHNGATGIQIESDPTNPNAPICRNIVITDNLCEYNAYKYTSETGIWVDDSNDVIVQNNIMLRNEIGLEITGSFNVIARNNIIYENNRSNHNCSAGILIRNSTQRDANGNDTFVRSGGNDIIVHNTLYRNAGTYYGVFAQVSIGHSAANRPADNAVFKNNISSCSLASQYCNYLDLWVYGLNPELNYNDYFQPAQPLHISWQSEPCKVDFNNWPEYKTKSGQDLYSITDDPCFFNPYSNEPNNEDFHLRPDSKCIDAGGFLTFTEGNGTDCNILVVQDARYFTDGYGVINGDLIRVGSNPLVRVLDVNYDTNIIIIDQNLSWNNDDGVSYDYRGSSPDIGAYEYGPLVYNKSQNISYENIQDAINGSSNGDEIIIYPGIYHGSIDLGGKTITLRSADPNDPNVVNATVINGNGAANAIIVGTGSNVTLKGLTITGGQRGIYSIGSSPVISNCIIKNNTSSGVYADSSATPTIKNCFIYDNSSGLVFQNASGIVRNNTIVNNINYGIQASGSSPTISNCILWNNGDDLYNCSVTYSCIEDIEDSGQGNIHSNPLFINADNNDFHLRMISSCVNNGDSTGISMGETDIDGQARIIGKSVDIGTDEYNVVPNHWWKLDETSGTIAYDSNGSANGTFNGNDPCWVNGFINGAADFNGVSDYFSVPSLDGSYNPYMNNVFSIAGWFRTTKSTGIQTIVGNWIHSRFMSAYYYIGWQVLVENNKLIARFGLPGSDVNDITGTHDVNGGQWHHFALVFNTMYSDSTLYLDGQPEAAKRTYGLTGGKFRIGDGSYVDYGNPTVMKGGPFCGTIDDIMIFNRVLSADEVSQIYHAGFNQKVYNPGNGKYYPSIQSAIDDSISGDLIEISPGLYNESLNLDSKNITLSSSDASNYEITKSTIINGNGTANVIAAGASSNVVLKGITIFGGNTGVNCSSGNMLLSNCAVTGNVSVGVFAQSENVTIINSLIYGNGNGLNLQNATGTVRNNTIVKNTNYGIQVSQGNGPEISNCILWANGSDISQGYSATYSCIEDGNPGTGNISSYPYFADYDNNDFHLTWNSPCINKGDPCGSYIGQTDIDGEEREMDSQADIGADEINDIGIIYLSPYGCMNEPNITESVKFGSNDQNWIQGNILDYMSDPCIDSDNDNLAYRELKAGKTLTVEFPAFNVDSNGLPQNPMLLEIMFRDTVGTNLAHVYSKIDYINLDPDYLRWTSSRDYHLADLGGLNDHKWKYIQYGFQNSPFQLLRAIDGKFTIKIQNQGQDNLPIDYICLRKITENEYKSLSKKQRELTGFYEVTLPIDAPPVLPEYGDLTVFARDIMHPVYKNTKPDVNEPNSINAFGTWGEVEPVSFSIYSKNGVNDVNITVSNLTHESFSEANIPASSIEIYKVVYNETRLGAIFNYLVNKGYALLPDRIEEFTSLSIEPNTSKSVWLKIHAPNENAGLPPGLYKGAVTIKTEGETDVNVPIEFNIYDITLDRPAATNPGWVGPYSRIYSSDMNVAFEAFRETGFDPFECPVSHAITANFDNNEWTFNSSNFEHALDRMISEGYAKDTIVIWIQTSYIYPYTYKSGGNPGDDPNYYYILDEPNFKNGFGKYIEAYINSVHNKAPNMMVQFFAVDEPGQNPQSRILADRLFTIIHDHNGLTTATYWPNCDEPCPNGVYNVPWVDGIPPLTNLVDYKIWSMEYEDDGYRRHNNPNDPHYPQKNDYFGYYTTGLSHYRNPIYNRFLHGLFAFGSEAKTVLAFAMGNYEDGFSSDPFNDFDSRNGNYLYPYPDPDYLFAYPTWSGKLLYTIGGLEAIREGIKDSRYIATLQRLIAEHPTNPTAIQANEFLTNLKNSIDPNYSKYESQSTELGHYQAILKQISDYNDPNDYEAFTRIRKQIAEYIRLIIVPQTLTVSSTAGGTVTRPGTGAFPYDYGTVVDLNAVPNNCYHFVNWAGDTSTIGNVNNPVNTITMNGDYTIQANFAINQYDITASTGPRGSINPSGTFSKDCGSSQDFNATPAGGYDVNTWYVDGSPVQTGGTTYTLSNITADHSVNVTFKIQTFSITGSSDTNGSISPTGTFSKDYSSSQDFNATPNAGYDVNTWYLDGSPVQSGGTTYTLCNITAAHTVNVTFKQLTYTVTASADANGSVAPTSAVIVYNDSQLFTANPYTDYEVNTWTLDGNTVQFGGTTYTLSNITASHSVSVSFKILLPAQATNPSPVNSASNVDVNTIVSWTAGARATSHDVYFGTASTPPFIVNQSGTTYNTGTLVASTTYYWRIDEKNAGGTTAGTVWNFTTVPPPPGAASAPSPAMGATNVSLTPTLSWTAGNGATSHDVYFGTASTPPFIVNQSGTTYNPGTLAASTTYYWRIDEKNAGGTTAGTVWNFTTISQPLPPPPVSVIGSWLSGTTHTKQTGTNRALVLLAHAKSSGTTPPSITGSVTYGGQTMTLVTSRSNSSGSTRTFTAAYILNEAGIAAATGNPPAFAVTWSNAASNVLDHVFLKDVNQTSLYGAFDSNQTSTGSAISTTSSLATTTGDMVIGAATCSGSGNYTANNSFSLALESNLSSGDSADINKIATGVNETPKISHSTTTSLQTIVGLVVRSIPLRASNPVPSNGATDVNLTQDLIWAAGSGATSHDVYFGTTNPPPFVLNQTGTTYDTGTMATNKTYYWRIDEHNAYGTTLGTVWSFTVPQPPGQASNPTPANAAIDVSITQVLSWTAGSGATSRDVYFGTTNPPSFKVNQTVTTYNPGTLANGKIYYWRIDEKNGGGTTTGTVWSFTTVKPAPTFVAAGTAASSTGAISPALPSGVATNDILLLFLETSNQAISISTPNGGTWTEVTNSPQSTGTAAGSTGARLTVFWSRYNGSQGAPTTSDSGDHQLGQMIAIRGAVTSGNPWDVTAGGVEAVADTSGSIPGATTTVANTLVVTAISTALPDADGTSNFSSWTNSNLTSLTEYMDNTTSQGNGGGLGIATGTKATAGAYGNTAVTCASSSYKAMMSIAIKP